MAGRETGRARRFLPEDARSAEGARKRRERLAAETQLVLMLQDPVYRERYEATAATLSSAMQTTAIVLARLEEQRVLAEAAVNDIRDTAARLPEGTRVYRDANGVVRREDGSAVDETLAATIIWTGNEPSFEAFRAARDRLDDIQADLDAVTDYQNDVLGPARDRITDEDNPPSLDELDRILDDLDDKMPDVVREAQTAPDTPEADSSTSVALPTLATKP
ncbi:MAG: hypothetical protein AAF526_02960 [Pseudomonadota bacterium]